MPKKSLYEILGVSSDADATIIKRRYRELARDLHPDKTGGDKAKSRQFVEVSAAYGVLSDEKKRAEYDRELTGTVGSSRIYGSIFGQDFEDLVERVRTEGISGGNLDDLISDFFKVAKRVQKEAPERMKATAEKINQVKTGVPPGEDPASPGGILGAIEALFGLDQIVEPPKQKRTRKKAP